MSGYGLLLVTGAGALFSLLAAAFWLGASLVKVPDNQDTFILALQKASRLNALGAVSACLSAVSAFILFLVPLT